MPGPESRMPRHAVCSTSDASAVSLLAETYFAVSARPGARLAAMKKTDPTQRAAKRKRTPQRSTAATRRPKGTPRGLVSRRTTARQKSKLRGS